MFVLIDGIGDVALPQLLDMTPLQVARTPVMDSISGTYALITMWSPASSLDMVLMQRAVSTA